MATRTFAVSKDARIATPGDLGAGASSYSPVGVYSGYTYRTLIDFSHDWSGMVAITSAILHLRVSTQHYVGFSSDPDVQIRRISGAWNEGTASSMTSSNSVTWGNQPGTVGSTKTADISTTEGAWDTTDITTIMQEALADGGTFYGLQIKAATESSGGDVTEFYSRETGSDPYITITYTTAPSNVAPSTPTGLSPASGTLGKLTPTLAFSHVDANGDALLKYDLQVSTDSTFATVSHWNLTNQTSGISGNAVSRAYAGTALTRGATYYWRARTYSATGVLTASPWTTAQSFRVNALPVVVLTQPSATDALIEMVKVPGSNVNPRMVVRWTFSDADAGQGQYAYWVVVQTDASGAFWDSGKVVSGDTSVTVPVDPVRGAFYRVTVSVYDSADEPGSVPYRRCKVQWGVAEYRTIDLGTVTAWSAVPTSTSGVNTLVVTEYASSAAGGAIAAANWRASLADAALDHFFHWRVYLFAWSGAASPSLTRMALTYTSDAGIVPDGWAVTSQHTLDTGVRVYGTQSLKAANNGTALRAYQAVKVEKNTRYILSGRVRSDGNSGAALQLAATASGAALVSSTPIVATQEFGRVFSTVWNSGGTETVYVIAYSNGATGTKAWFDALKLEASTVVTAWTPGFVGAAVVVDVGGIQVDKEAGAVMRLKGATGGLRDIVELGDRGLFFGGEDPAELWSPSADLLRVTGGLDVTGALTAGSFAFTPTDLTVTDQITAARLTLGGAGKFMQYGTGALVWAGINATEAVSFPVAFDGVPVVIAWRTQSTSSAPKNQIWAGIATTTGFSVHGTVPDGGTSAATIAYAWLAIDTGKVV